MRSFLPIVLTLSLATQALAAGGPFPPYTTPFAKGLLDDVDAPAMRTTLQLSGLATATTSANVTAAITGETGTGPLVCANEPEINEPYLTGPVTLVNGTAGLVKVGAGLALERADEGFDFRVPAPITRVQTDGDEIYYGLLATTDSERGAQLLAARAAAVSGDSIFLTGDTFALGNNVLDLSLGGTGAISLRGAGMLRTTITSSALLNASGPIVRPGNGSTVADVKVVGTLTDSSFQAAYGVQSTLAATACTTRAERCWFEGGSDGVFCRVGVAPNVYDFTFAGCEFRSQWDGVALFRPIAGTPGTLNARFSDCRSIATGGHAASPDQSHGINFDYFTRLVIDGGEWRSTSATGSESFGIFAFVSDAVEDTTLGRAYIGGGAIVDGEDADLCSGLDDPDEIPVSVDASVKFEAVSGDFIFDPLYGKSPSAAFLSLVDDTTVAAIRTTLSALAGVDIDTSAELAAILTDENGSVGSFLRAAGTAVIASGKTFTASNTITIAGTDGSTLNVGTGGALGTAAYTATSAYQAADNEVSALAGLTSAANKLPYYTGSGTAALADYTAAGRALDDDADAAAQRVTLGTNWYVKTIGVADFTSGGHAAPPSSTTFYLMDCIVTTDLASAIPMLVEKTGTIASVRSITYVGGTLGSAQTYSLAVSVNGGAFTTVDAGLLADAKVRVRASTTNLPISVTAGDQLVWRIITPAWTTGPTTWRTRVEATLNY